MQSLDIQVISAIAFLSGCIGEWQVHIQILQKTDMMAPINHSPTTRAQFIKSLDVLTNSARALGMTGVAIAGRRAMEDCVELTASPVGRDSHKLEQIVRAAERVLFAFVNELHGRVLFAMTEENARGFSAMAPFGDAVARAFPSAEYDIAEAAKCQALRRHTACVMHLMRVLEAGLKSLAKHYEVDSVENWNAALNQIEAKSRQIGKHSHGKEEEQWAAEAATHFRFIKNAWRNHAMHPSDIYNEDSAAAIFNSTRSFMQQLSKKLSEG